MRCLFSLSQTTSRKETATMFSTLLSWLRSESIRGWKPARPKVTRGSPLRPRVEALEDRMAPSMLGALADGLMPPSLGAASHTSQHFLDGHHVGFMSANGHKGNGAGGGTTFP